MINARTAGTEASSGLELWLVRHAESFGTVDNSGSNTSLTERGVEQAKRLGTVLCKQSFAQVYVSPLLRARETLQHALPEVPVQIDERLSEWVTAPTRVVDSSTLTPEELHSIVFAAPTETWESPLQFKARIAEFRTELPPIGRVLVVSHYAVLREWLGELLGFERLTQEISCAAVFRFFCVEGNTECLAWNDTTHLA